MPQRLIRATHQLAAASTPDDVLAVLAVVARPLHVLALWPLGAAIEPTTMQSQILYGPEFRDPAFQREINEGVTRHGPSPVATWALRHSAPFTLREAVAHLKLRGTDRWGVDLLARYGWKDGLYIPAGSGWMTTFMSKEPLKGQLGTEFRLVLAMCAEGAVAMLDGMRRAPKSPALSANEVTALRHLALGHNGPTIAAHLGVRKSAVDSYLDRAKRKLKAENQTHAVALAIHRRLI